MLPRHGQRTGSAGLTPLRQTAALARDHVRLRSAAELLAAAHCACYAMALRLGERKAVPERPAISATVTVAAALEPAP